MAPGELQEKVVVIIGGSTGLGLSGAAACVAAGARVVVVGRKPEGIDAAVRTLGADCAMGMAGDASDPATAPAAIELAVKTFGACHALYHIAGGSGRRMGDGRLHEMTDEGLAATIALNLNSVVYSNRAAVRHFQKQGQGGVILNMGSVLGWSPSAEFFATHGYAATKAAIVGFTKSIAAAYATDDIRVNVIAPGLFETPMAQRAAEDDAILAFIKTKQPLDGGRMGQPGDCDGAAVYLLSDASRFVTGQVLAVDGGWTVSEGQIPR